MTVTLIFPNYGYLDVFLTLALFGLFLQAVLQEDFDIQKQDEQKRRAATIKQGKVLRVFVLFAFLRFVAEVYESIFSVCSRLTSFQRAEYLRDLEIGSLGFAFIFIGLFIGYQLSLRASLDNEKTFLLNRLVFVTAVNVVITVVLAVQGLDLFWVVLLYDVGSIVFLIRDFTEEGWCNRFLVQKNDRRKERLAMDSCRRRFKAFRVYWGFILFLFLLFITLILVLELLMHVPIFEHRFGDARKLGFIHSVEALWVFSTFKISQWSVDFSDLETWYYSVGDWENNAAVCNLLLLGGTFKLLALLSYIHLYG